MKLWSDEQIETAAEHVVEYVNSSPLMNPNVCSKQQSLDFLQAISALVQASIDNLTEEIVQGGHR